MQSQNYSSLPDTRKHIGQVGVFLSKIAILIMCRISGHDQSKLEQPEIEYFDAYTPKLSGSTYGSDKYTQFLKEMEPALKHHYAVNRHHPEHFENGIRGMNLVDIIEMFCDWHAAAKRHADGDLMKSIGINQNRFHYSDDLKAVFENTYKDIFAEEQDV
jgi:hypothetical protein